MWRHSHSFSPRTRRGTRRIPALVLLTGASVVAVNATPMIALASAAHSPPGGTAGVTSPDRVGRAPAAIGATPLHVALSRSKRLQVDIGLLPRDPSALAAYATAVSTPGSVDYHHFLTEAQFVSRFGPTPTSVDVVETQLRKEGLNPGPISPNHLLLPVTARAGAVAKAFKTTFRTYKTPNGRTAYANTSAPYLGSAARYVQSVIGLDNLSKPHRLGLVPDRQGIPHLVAPSTTSGPQPCKAASTTAASWGTWTANQIDSSYNFQDLYKAGDEGAGITVAVFELEGNFPNDITAFQACYGSKSTVKYIPEDGGAPAANAQNGDGIETELDIENIIGTAPKASVDVYQAPNTNTGLLDNYTAMIAKSAVSVISTSWGDCEYDSGASLISEENTLFQEAATQGKTIFAAAGDDGSSDCYPSISNAAPAVDDPASQPYVTGVGGTTTTSDTAPPAQAVWNESTFQEGAGGGGVSLSHTMPSYQSGASGLNVINSNSSGQPCGAGSGSYCREVPDVSANADPVTGYVIYWDGGWTVIGGTSGAAPLWAGFTALTDASFACGGSSIGFANPLLYEVASSSYTANFFDVTSGNNDYTPDGYTGGLYPAGRAYDMASGLGTPNGANLPAALCDAVPSVNSITVAKPGAQSTMAGSSASLQMHATDSGPEPITWSAQGLPTGLSINSSSGLISGTAKATGTSFVTVKAEDTTKSHGMASFSWKVSRAATTTRIARSLSSVSFGHEHAEKFSVTVSAAGSLVPSGTVRVKSGSVSLCKVTLVAGRGSCDPAATAIGVGSHQVEALYAQTSEALASSGATTLVATKEATTTALTLSKSQIVHGHENLEHLSVKVKPTYMGSPGGSVRVKAGSKTLCTITLSGGRGGCTLSASKLAVGIYYLVAHYGGAADFKASSSAKKSLKVT